MSERTRTQTNPFGLPNIVIPAEVLFNEDLTWREKALFGFLSNLTSNEQGYCWASNRYLAGLLNVLPRNLSTMLSKLQKLGYIRITRDTGPSGKPLRKVWIDRGYVVRYSTLLEQRLIGTVSKGCDDCEDGEAQTDNPSLDTLSAGPETPFCSSRNPFLQDQKPLSAGPETELDSRIREEERSYSQLGRSDGSDGSSGFFHEGDVPTTSPVDTVIQLYTELCPSLPQVRKVPPRRKKAILARLKDYPIPTLKEAFRKAEASNFLSGRSGAWTGCNLDWLMNENNLVKVLEDRYANNTGGKRTVSVPRASRPLEEVFPNKTLLKAFRKRCLEPARDLLGVEEDEVSDRLVDLHTQIDTAQQKLSRDLRSLLPGPLEIVADYITWLEDTEWITDPSPACLDGKHSLFAKFKREAAKQDNQERDPVTGRSYIRG